MSRNIDDLDPRVAKQCFDFKAACKAAGIDVGISATYRSPEEQNKLYAIGRTVKGQDVTVLRPMGRKVTNAKAGESMHGYRLAFDFFPYEHGKPAWNNTALFTRCGEIAESLGLEWAGRWKSMRELAHCQNTFGLTLVQLQLGQRP